MRLKLRKLSIEMFYNNNIIDGLGSNAFFSDGKIYHCDNEKIIIVKIHFNDDNENMILYKSLLQYEGEMECETLHVKKENFFEIEILSTHIEHFYKRFQEIFNKYNESIEIIRLTDFLNLDKYIEV